MSPELHNQVRRLFDAAMERPEAERRAFLERETAGSPGVLEQVLNLLDANREVGSFLRPAAATTRQVGRYLLGRELGQGGMGVVFEALDPAINRKVALKLIRPGHALLDSGGFNRDALLREARAAGSLHHQGIVTIYDVGEDQGARFVAMELVEGPSLYSVLTSRPRLDPAQAIEILRQIGAALDYAHGHGIIHRDIKPANILLEGGTTAKITDFGIAKITTAQHTGLSGMLVGTAAYMSPEQIESKPLDGRSDQFALAAMAYEMLTGTVPFTGETAASVSFKIVNDQRPSARAANPGLSPAADPVLGRGLARLPAERFATCSEFVAALDAALKTAVAPEPPTQKSIVLPPAPAPALPEPPTRPSIAPTPPSPTSPPPTRSLLPAVAFSLAIAALLGGALFKWQPWRTRPPSDTAPPVEKTVAAPVVSRFLAGPASVAAGAASTLTWETSGASAVEIEPQVGAVAASGSYAVKPAETTVYVLTAKGPGGSVSVRASVDVQPAVKSRDSKLPKAPDKRAEIPQPELPKPEAPKPELPKVVSPPPKVAPPTAEELYTQAVADLRGDQPAKAAAQFQQAAERGDARSMFELGNLYRSGKGVARNPVEAVKWFTNAAQAGNASAMVFLGSMYIQGDGVLRRPEEAVRWFRQAADAGNPVAMDALGQMYWSGNGVVKDEREGVQWFQKAVAKGNTSALYDLAMAYETGRGVKPDANTARNLFLQAANAGEKRARARLAK